MYRTRDNVHVAHQIIPTSLLSDERGFVTPETEHSCHLLTKYSVSRVKIIRQNYSSYKTFNTTYLK